jgi:endonuclease/exonuclease/phosphatase (EEP) superfamily protein YafD
MTIWAFVVFALGFIVFLFYIFDIFTSFAPWIWSIILFIIALGMLNRIWTKEKEGEKEKLAERVSKLEEELNWLQQGKQSDQGK